MADEIVDKVTVAFGSTGYAQMVQQLQAVEKQFRGAVGALDQSYKSGGINQTTLSSATRALDKQEKSAIANATAFGRVNTQQKSMSDHLPRLRYALYDVSTTATVAGAAMLGLAAATLGTSITMDRKFADVVRTTGTYLDKTGESTRALRSEFNDLFASMPASWGTLTQIGALAGQLGIASDNAAEFTSLIVMLSTATDLSAEQAATSMARLSELLDVPASQFENLGSAILATGTASIATETQITRTATEIASMGSFAGMSAQQVIGLSSTLASLGVQPELARGTITRLFTNISTAIANGGDRLEALGRVAGTSGQEFAKAWGTDATGALQSLLVGLDGVERSQAVLVLREMGITAARDIPTILKLSQNHKMLADQLGISSKGFEDGTALQEQYGVIVETVAEKLNILKNNFTLLVSKLGASTGPLSSAIDLLTTLLQGLNKMADNKSFQGISMLVIGVTALGGVLLLAVGAMARLGASGAALMTARVGLLEMTGAAYTARTGLDAATASTWRLAASVKGVKLALISTGIGAAFVALGTAIAYFVGKADKSQGSIGGMTVDLQGLQDAMTKDTEAALAGTATAFQTLTYYTDKNGRALSSAEATNLRYSDAMANLGKAADDTTSSVKEQEIAVGGLTEAWLLNELTTGAFAEKFQEIWPEIQTLTNEAGLNIEDTLTRALGGEKVDFTALKQKLTTQLDDVDRLIKARYAKIVANSPGASPDSLSSTVQDDSVIQKLYARQKAIESNQEAVSKLGAFFLDLNGKIATTAEKIAIFDTLSGVLGDTGSAADQAASDFEALTARTQESIDMITSVVGATLDTESALDSLGKSLQQGGLDWSNYTDAGRDNISNLIGAMDAIATENAGDPLAIAADYRALFEMLIRGGYASEEQLRVLTQAMAALPGGASIRSSGRDMSSFFNGWSSGAQKAAKSTRSARKEIRTLSDYVSDLSKVLGDTFTYKFGFQTALDDTLTKFRSIEDTFDEARKKMRDLTQEIQRYNAEIGGTKSDIAILEYHLSIAIDYNDALRAEAIRAELAAKNADLAESQASLASTQNDLNQATQESIPDLTSNTRAAINQRAAVQGLVKSYQDQIIAYAQSGASQQQISAYTAQLTNALSSQLLALGYNRTEVQNYTATLWEFKTVVDAVPRNLTITMGADMGPAQLALAEFQARLDATRANAAQGIALGAGTYLTWDQWVRANATGISASASAAAWTDYIAKARSKYKSYLTGYGYAGGGFTGRGGMYDYAGDVHRGEYVVPKRDVNQSTGLPKADALARLGRGATASPGFSSGGFAGSSATPFMSLTAGTIQALAQAVQPYLFLDGQLVSQSTNVQNAKSTSLGAF